MIKIRPHVRGDIINRIKWLNNIEATRFAVDNPENGTTAELQNNWFDKYEAAINKQFFTICLDSQPIGFMGLSNISNTDKNASVFILIGEDEFRGKGYGVQSMKWLIEYSWKVLDLNSLTLEVKVGNFPALKLYEKLGFKHLNGSGGEDVAMLLTRQVIKHK